MAAKSAPNVPHGWKRVRLGDVLKLGNTECRCLIESERPAIYRSSGQQVWSAITTVQRMTAPES